MIGKNYNRKPMYIKQLASLNNFDLKPINNHA